MPTDINFPQQPSQPQYPSSPPPPPPRSGSNVWKWVIGSCLGIVVLGMIAFFILVRTVFNDPGMKAVMQNAQSSVQDKPKLLQIHSALNKYKKAHEGNYPNSLEDLVKAKYLSESSLTSGTAEVGKFIYTKPAKDAPDNTPVVSTRPKDTKLFNTKTTLSISLLISGEVVPNQSSRPITQDNGQ